MCVQSFADFPGKRRFWISVPLGDSPCPWALTRRPADFLSLRKKARILHNSTKRPALKRAVPDFFCVEALARRL